MLHENKLLMVKVWILIHLSVTLPVHIQLSLKHQIFSINVCHFSCLFGQVSMTVYGLFVTLCNLLEQKCPQIP